MIIASNRVVTTITAATTAGEWFCIIVGIATIAKIELKSTSVIIAKVMLQPLASGFHVIATLADFFFSDNSHQCDHVETGIKPQLVDCTWQNCQL